MTHEIDINVKKVGADNADYFARRVRPMDVAIDLTMDTGKRFPAIESDGEVSSPTPKPVRGDRGDSL